MVFVVYGWPLLSVHTNWMRAVLLYIVLLYMWCCACDAVHVMLCMWCCACCLDADHCFMLCYVVVQRPVSDALSAWKRRGKNYAGSENHSPHQSRKRSHFGTLLFECMCMWCCACCLEAGLEAAVLGLLRWGCVGTVCAVKGCTLDWMWVWMYISMGVLLYDVR